MKLTLPFVLLVLFLLAGCARNPAGTSIVAGGETATVAVTVTVPPTATPEPTATATLPPTATATAVPSTPSPTASPTETPSPTYTPTATPAPTETPASTPTVTQLPATQQPAATTTSSVDLRSILRDQITTAMLEVGHYRGIVIGDIRVIQVLGAKNEAVDCVATVASYDQLVGSVNLDLNEIDDPVVQNAYNVARAAVDQFVVIAKPWTDGCRQSIAEGVIEKEMDRHQRDLIIQALELPDDTFNQAFHILDE